MVSLWNVLSVGAVLCVVGVGIPARANTIAQFNFDSSDENGTTFSDASGNGHDAVYNKALTLQDSDPFDAKGTEVKDRSAVEAVNKPGKQTQARLSKLDTINLSATNHFTIEGWINLSSLPGKEGGKLVQLISKDSGTTSIILGVDSEGKAWARVYSKGGGGGGFSGTTTIPLDTWTHLALTYDGKDAALFVNGKQEATKKIGRSLPKSLNQVVVGNYVAGAIDDVRISDEVLPAEELGFHKSFTGESKPTGNATTKPAAEGATTKP
jgi:hypothetical protein